jgi:hypothetical protein
MCRCSVAPPSTRSGDVATVGWSSTHCWSALGWSHAAARGDVVHRRWFPACSWIAARPGRRLRSLCLAFLPIVAVCSWMAANNFARSGHAVITTSRQVVMVQAVLPLIKKGLPVFDGDDLFDRTARDTLRGDDYGRIEELNKNLFLAGLTAPEIADEATRRYFRAWLRFPAAMLVATVGATTSSRFHSIRSTPFAIWKFLPAFPAPSSRTRGSFGRTLRAVTSVRLFGS